MPTASLTDARTALEHVLTDRRTNLVVTFGVFAAHAAPRRSGLPKPVVVPLVANRGSQDLPYQDVASSRKDLS